MKIAIDVRRIRDFGIGTYIRNLLNSLAAIDSENQYLLIAPPGEVAEFRHLPANFQAVPYSRSDQSRLDHVAFPLFLERLNVALTHIPFNRVPLFMPRPYVVTVHDVSNLLFDKAHPLLRRARFLRFRHGLLRADRILAVSAATKRDLCERVPVPDSRICLVYNAPDPQFFEARPVADARAAGPDAAERERHRIIERYQIKGPFLLYAGNIRPQKNIPRLVEAFAVVRNRLKDHPQYADLRLLIIGDEISKSSAVRRAVRQSRVEQYVRFLGFVPFGMLRVFYSMAAAFVFPSLYEGFGLPPLEAMASGTPVVSSGVSSLGEVVGDAAHLVNPENVFDIARGIEEVLLDDELRATLIARGKRQASHFSWDRTASSVLKVYREVAAARGTR